VRLEIAGFQLDRPPRRGQRLVVPPGGSEDLGEVAVERGVVGAEGPRVCDEPQRRLGVAALLGDEGEAVGGDEVVGVGREDVAVRRLRLVQPAAPLVVERDGEQLVRRHGWGIVLRNARGGGWERRASAAAKRVLVTP